MNLGGGSTAQPAILAEQVFEGNLRVAGWAVKRGS